MTPLYLRTAIGISLSVRHSWSNFNDSNSPVIIISKHIFNLLFAFAQGENKKYCKSREEGKGIAMQPFGVPSTGKNCITTAIKRQTSKLKCSQNINGAKRTKSENKKAATTMGINNKNNKSYKLCLKNNYKRRRRKA